MIRPFILILLMTLAYSCSRKKNESREIVTSLVGHEIVWPDSMTVRIQKDTIPFDFNQRGFKIVTYIDSTGCTSCRLRLADWEKVINSLNSLGEIGFLMILNSPYQDEVDYKIKTENFLHPVTLDPEGRFEQLNRLSKTTIYNTFLLDYENKIVAVGNPAVNPKIRELYRDIITESTEPSPTLELCENPCIAFGAARQGDTVVRKFSLVNHTDSPLTLQEIVPSCFCTTATVSSNRILPEDSMTVIMKYTPDSTIGAVQRYIDVYFDEKEYPQRLTLSGYSLGL